MPQTKYDIAIDNKEEAEQFVQKTSSVQGVKWVNVNIEHGSIVVTHDDSYDEAAFKAAGGI